MKKRKILYLITKSNWGGAQRYVYDLATHIDPREFEVVVAAGGKGLLFSRLRDAGIRTIPVPGLVRDVNPFKEIKAFFYLCRMIRREKPDTVHLNSTKMGLLGALAARLAGAFVIGYSPFVIFTVHGWGFHEDRNYAMKGVLWISARISSLFHAKTIVLNKADFKSGKKFISSRRLSLIPLAIGQQEFISCRESRSALFRLTGRDFPPDAFVIGTIAELTRNKGLRYLIEAIDQMKFRAARSKFRVVIIGDGEDKHALTKEIRALDLEKIIDLAGFIPNASRYMRAFDVFLLPSVKEGSPYVILEALAAGIPIIATDVGGIPDLIGKMPRAALIPARDSGALREAIEQCMEHESRPHTVKEKDAADREFHDMIEKTSALYT